MGKNLTLLNRNLSVKNSVNKKWHTVRASVGFDEGVHQWHVRIDTCVSKNIFIGVCTSQASMENYIGSDGFGYGFLANKAVWHNKSKLHSYGEIFKQGDLLQVTLDCNAKTLAFSRNGEYLGTAATNLHAAAPGSSSYASSSSLLPSSMSEACKWYPAFSMYNKDDQLTIIPSSSETMLANSARQQQQQHASILELVEAMQVVNAYHQTVGGSTSPEATARAHCSTACRHLYTAAYEDFCRWERGEILFRERELGHFIRVDGSRSATQRFGFFKGDVVFSSRGQAAVLGEFNHELWFECDSSVSNSSEQDTAPGLGSWSLHACKQMLASPSEFPVHRHTRSHQQDQYYPHQYPDDPLLESFEHDEEKPLGDSGEEPMAVTAESFDEYQEQWTRIPRHEARDAKLIEILDGIAASRAVSDSQCLSFVDISAAFLLDKVIASPFFAMLGDSGVELSTQQIMTRIGLLLYVNRSLCKVVRLVLAEPTAPSKWSVPLLSKSLIATEPRAKRETDATEDEAKDKTALSDDAEMRNTYANAIIASDVIAGLANSPYWNPSDPSRFANMDELASRLLFRSQKAKLMNEAMRKTATPTLHSLVNSDLQSQTSELTSSAREESYDPSDLPRIH
ncbi:E3 ubiquitin-protein ligase herc1, partial [Globisporangium polare]